MYLLARAKGASYQPWNFFFTSFYMCFVARIWINFIINHSPTFASVLVRGESVSSVTAAGITSLGIMTVLSTQINAFCTFVDVWWLRKSSKRLYQSRRNISFFSIMKKLIKNWWKRENFFLLWWGRKRSWPCEMSRMRVAYF